MRTMNRRRFLHTSTALLGAACYGIGGNVSRSFAQHNPAELIAVRNGAPDEMFARAITAAGGMKQFVRSGQTVVVKPNIGWNRGPETGANTHPLLVKSIVEAALAAGAKKVYVFDNTVSWGWKAYKNSGIEAAAVEAGAQMVPADKERYYHEVEIPGAVVLKKTKVHELYLEADTVINVPVLKHHGSTRLTIAMKNLMGVVWDRGWYHDNGLHQAIADFCLQRTPDLNVVDAYRITLRNGPSRAGPGDLLLRKSLLLSKDIVGVDAASAKLFGIRPSQVRYIALGEKAALGSAELENRPIKKIAL